jgi:hypothetical protein
VVPIDVVEHLLAGVDQRVEGADPLATDRDPPRRRPVRRGFHDPEGVDQAGAVDPAVGHVAGAGIARQVVQFVHIERAGKHAPQHPVSRRKVTTAGIDDGGDAGGIDPPGVSQDRRDLRPLDDSGADRLVGHDRRPKLFDRMGERVVADVVEEGGRGDHPGVLVSDPGSAGG